MKTGCVWGRLMQHFVLNHCNFYSLLALNTHNNSAKLIYGTKLCLLALKDQTNLLSLISQYWAAFMKVLCRVLTESWLQFKPCVILRCSQKSEDAVLNSWRQIVDWVGSLSCLTLIKGATNFHCWDLGHLQTPIHPWFSVLYDMLLKNLYINILHGFPSRNPNIAQNPPDKFLNIKLWHTCIARYKQVIQLQSHWHWCQYCSRYIKVSNYWFSLFSNACHLIRIMRSINSVENRIHLWNSVTHKL